MKTDKIIEKVVDLKKVNVLNNFTNIDHFLDEVDIQEYSIDRIKAVCSVFDKHPEFYDDEELRLVLYDLSQEYDITKINLIEDRLSLFDINDVLDAIKILSNEEVEFCAKNKISFNTVEKLKSGGYDFAKIKKYPKLFKETSMCKLILKWSDNFIKKVDLFFNNDNVFELFEIVSFLDANKKIIDDDYLNKKYNAAVLENIKLLKENNIDFSFCKNNKEILSKLDHEHIKCFSNLLMSDVYDDIKKEIIKNNILFGRSHTNFKFVNKAFNELPKADFNKILPIVTFNTFEEKHYSMLKENISFFTKKELEIVSSAMLYGSHIKDITPFLSRAFTVAQKDALRESSTTFFKNFDLTLYINELYSPAQIRFLGKEITKRKDITPALDPTYSIEHMKHKIFFNSIGKKFKTEEEYDTNYKNYIQNFYEFVSDIDMNDTFVSYAINKFTKLNRLYNFNFDIDKIINERIYIAEDYLDKEVQFGIKYNVDISKYLNGDYNDKQKEVIKNAIELGLDYEQLLDPALPAKKMKEKLSVMNSKRQER